MSRFNDAINSILIGSSKVRRITSATFSLVERRHPRRPGLVAQQPLDPGLDVARLPAPHGRLALAGPAHDLGGPDPAAVGSIIPARHTCFCGRFRSATSAAKRSRSAALTNNPRFPRIRKAYHGSGHKEIFRYRQSTSLVVPLAGRAPSRHRQQQRPHRGHRDRCRRRSWRARSTSSWMKATSSRPARSSPTWTSTSHGPAQRGRRLNVQGEEQRRERAKHAWHSEKAKRRQPNRGLRNAKPSLNCATQQIRPPSRRWSRRGASSRRGPGQLKRRDTSTAPRRPLSNAQGRRGGRRCGHRHGQSPGHCRGIGDRIRGGHRSSESRPTSTTARSRRRATAACSIASRKPGEVLAAGGKVLNMVDLTDVYMTFFLPEASAGRVAIGAEARLVLDAAPQYVIPAKRDLRRRRRAVHAQDGGDGRGAAEADVPGEGADRSRSCCAKHIRLVKTGLPGVAYVRSIRTSSGPPSGGEAVRQSAAHPTSQSPVSSGRRSLRERQPALRQDASRSTTSTSTSRPDA